MPGISNQNLNVDAAVRWSQFQDQDVSAADSANKVPLFCSNKHDVYAIGIESVVTKAGDTNGADVVVSIGTIADPDMVGTVTVAKAATPAINTMEDGTMNSATGEPTHEGRNGVRIPKGTPVYATYTASGSNVAQRAVAIRYVVCDENFED